MANAPQTFMASRRTHEQRLMSECGAACVELGRRLDLWHSQARAWSDLAEDMYHAALGGDSGRVVTLWETRSSRLPEREVRHE